MAMQQGLEAVGLNEHDLACDPAMASCCLKDLENQRKGDELRRKLRECDITEVQLDMRADMFMPAVGTQGQAAGSDLDSGDLGSGDDGELHDLRTRRMRELQQQAQAAARAHALGHGMLVDVLEAQLLERIESSSYSISHLAVEGYEPCNEVDEILTSLAHHFKGTLFLRVAVSRHSKLRQQLQMQALPGLVCCRDGTIIGRVPFSQFSSPDEVLEEEVVACLRRLGVLHRGQQAQPRELQGGPQGPGGGVHADSDSRGGNGCSEDEEEPSTLRDAPCEICGRRYPHEHVKAVYRDRRSSDEEEEED